MRAAQSGFLGIALNWADLAFFLAVAILPPSLPWLRGTNSLFFSCFRERERGEERRRVHQKREEQETETE